ncbi:MAG: septation ring formation regulator EzrA [bacterium]
MSKETFILLAVIYYVVSIIFIVVLLMLFNKRIEKRYKNQIDTLERGKNLIISTSILSELNKVETLANNDDLKNKYESWKERFNVIKDSDVSRLSDEINDIEALFYEKNFKELKLILLNAEINLNSLKTKSELLLEEIKEITTSEERNRTNITKLKSEFRDIMSTYKNDEFSYEIIKKPIEAQFESTDKLFKVFENLMEKNEYTEVNKVVKVIEDIIKNLTVIMEESKTIISLGTTLIPRKIEEVMYNESKLEKDGFNLDYLNIEYNKQEAEKKIVDVFERLQSLNIKDSLFEFKTIHDYFDSLLSDFEKEKIAKKHFEDYTRSIILKCSKLEKINNELLKKIDDIKYSYDLTDDEVSIVYVIRESLLDVRSDYDKVIESHRAKREPFTKLTKKMENLKIILVKTEEKLNLALRTLGSLKEDEKRAREQLEEIKVILQKTKEKVRSYKLPFIPKNYHIELADAMQAIEYMNEELDRRPISIKTLNTRVDTARDLVLKVYSTVNETIKTAKMAESTIVYGNRYRVTNKEVDLNLTKAENAFNKGNFKLSLENAINAINIVEPGIHKKLLEEYK